MPARDNISSGDYDLAFGGGIGSQVGGLAVRAVSHAYGGTPVLDRAVLTAKSGEITCLLGASGVGKSTILRLIGGHERVQSGEIVLDGSVLADRGTHRVAEHRPVGFVFQDAALFPHMRVLDNVMFGLSGREKGERVALARDVLAAMGLGDLGRRYPHELSGGQAQRVALARALAPRPRVVLLDEPFANVDPALRRNLREDARETLKALDTIVLLVTHDPEEAMEMGDSVAVMANGRVVQQGTPRALHDQPQHAAVCTALGVGQLIRGRVENTTLHTDCGPIELNHAPDGALQGRVVEASVRVDALGLETPGDAALAPWAVRETRFASGGGHIALVAARLCDHRGPCLRVDLGDVDPNGLRPGHGVVLRQVGDGVHLFAP